MSMLDLTRDGSRVLLNATSWTANTTFRLAYDAGAEWAARLLWSELRRTLGLQMAQARRDAYEQGWKDRAAKRRKETFFSEELP